MPCGVLKRAATPVPSTLPGPPRSPAKSASGVAGGDGGAGGEGELLAPPPPPPPPPPHAARKNANAKTQKPEIPLTRTPDARITILPALRGLAAIRASPHSPQRLQLPPRARRSRPTRRTAPDNTVGAARLRHGTTNDCVSPYTRSPLLSAIVR